MPPTVSKLRPAPDLGESLCRKTVEECIERALGHLARTQSDEGSWKGDYGGPLFLLPMYVGTTYAIGALPDDATCQDMARYIRNHQNDDGGWGLHVEAPSSVFTSVLNYVALRLLGILAEDAQLARGRAWIHRHGGPLASASWGKFFLCLLNLYDYEGIYPITPELWLLPEALPLHPSRLWCHCRMVYLPMSWLYGKRVAVPLDDTLTALRGELYVEPYEVIDWKKQRSRVSSADNLTPPSLLAKGILPLMASYENHLRPALRERALDHVLEQIGYEDRNTDYICIGPVNKLLHTWVWHFVNPDGGELKEHLRRLPDYLYQAQDGTKMQGYNSSELWDTAFAVQSIFAAGGEKRFPDMIKKAHRFIEGNQVLEDVAERKRCYRDPSQGGWPFSTRSHGWPITDCTAEGIKSSLLLESVVEDPLTEARFTDAVDLILFWQNPNGGWATYERMRGPGWLERLNPSNCFGDIMVDYPYVECTSTCVQAMAAFRRRFPGRRDRQIDAAIDQAREFLVREQREDGSWYGSWGICFTYGAWFGVWGLRAAGLPPTHPVIARACQFLLRKQLEDGGWGELAESSRISEYVSTEGGQAVMTSWALLALMEGGYRESIAVTRGLRFLVDRQNEDGSWPSEHIAGMFNKTSAIHYDNYLKIFPLWALARARDGISQ